MDIFGGKQIRPLIHIDDITNLRRHKKKYACCLCEFLFGDILCL